VTWIPDNYEQAFGALEECRKMNTEKRENIVELNATINALVNTSLSVASDIEFIEVSTNKLADKLDAIAQRLRDAATGRRYVR
jgi:hypothetical protein